ncbi:MAG: methyl-accepting chemotaxis protein, partial [Undibacterium curvum]
TTQQNAALVEQAAAAAASLQDQANNLSEVVSIFKIHGVNNPLAKPRTHAQAARPAATSPSVVKRAAISHSNTASQRASVPDSKVDDGHWEEF